MCVKESVAVPVQTLKPLLSHLRVLLRVRMLYYLKQEVIGEHADSVLKGADIRYLTALHSISQMQTHTDSITEVDCCALQQSMS